MDGSAQTQQSNTVEATRNLVAAQAAASVNRIVLVSSFAVYDYASLNPGDVLTEDTALDHDSAVRGPYVRAKLEQERLVRDAGRGLRWTVVRPGLIFGRDRTWFYQLGLRLSRRVWLSLAGAGTLPLTWVDNCAAAVAAALDAPQSEGRTINIVDDDLPARSWYMRRVAQHEPSPPTVLDLPWPVLSATAQTAWFGTHGIFRDRLSPPGMLHPAVLAARCKPLRYDNALAHRLLGWTPEVSIEDALRQLR
jgi:nucleoside-diphosphate-sugar epimerase